MDAGVLPSPTSDSILKDAHLLNSDIGRHSVKCNFSSRLTGRFYQNGSLERHTFRKSRLVEMQARKRRLEKELQLEEYRVKFLEERLCDTERAREDAHEMLITIGRGVVQYQAFVRRRQALRLFRSMQHEAHMKCLVAQFFQRRYRGWRGRVLAASRRQYLKDKHQNEAAAYIQANVRRRTQRKRYLNLLLERQRLNNQSAVAIQARTRCNITRRKYLAEMSLRHNATTSTQRVWRGKLGRLEAERLRQEQARKRSEAEKPKRVPLHLRKYSTYGAAPRRTNGSKKKRDVRMRRRSSDAMIGLSSSLSTLNMFASTGDPDENDSIASTITSATGADDSSSKRLRNHQLRQPHLWPSPQRVVRANRQRHTVFTNSNANSLRRGSQERRMTISVGLPNPLRPPRERLSILQTCKDSDSIESSSRESRNSSSSNSSDPPPRQMERIKTPITVSGEAAIIVQEVLGKGVLIHSIAYSVFDDDLSEHEDDLSN